MPLTRRHWLQRMLGVAAGAPLVDAVFAAQPTSASKGSASGYTLSTADDALLEDLSRRTFQFFVDHAGTTGIVRDRARTDGSPPGANHRMVGSIAATGFGLTGLCIAADRGWMPRAEARTRVHRTLTTFAHDVAPVHGWFYHWLNIDTGAREWKSELSSIDTALLVGGVIAARQAWRDDAEIVRLATTIVDRLDWQWMLNGHATLLSHGWYPERGFITNRWDHYSELLLLYVLGLGAANAPLTPASWRAWDRPANSYAGIDYVGRVPPLFVHQFSHAWIDFRGWRDPQAPHDWHENSVRATRAHRQFCLDLAEEFPGCYGPNLWGLTASDTRGGYKAWGGPPRTPDIDGSVVPCAAAGSLMFTPDLCVPAVRHMRERFGDRLYGRYGFADAFHPVDGWTNPDVIGIDLGITLLAAENLRSGRVWRWVMQDADVRRGLARAGLAHTGARG